MPDDAAERLALLDYRRRVAAIYAAVRGEDVPIEQRWSRFRQQRQLLFREHSLSPVPPHCRESLELAFFDYDPRWRVQAEVLATAPLAHALPLRHDGDLQFTRLGRARFEVAGQTMELTLQWLGGYGGGLLLAFRDSTSGRETYGGGRYLLDTIKGADLGGSPGALMLDFNFACYLSCAYDARWHCPLPDRDSWMSVDVRVGERTI